MKNNIEEIKRKNPNLRPLFVVKVSSPSSQRIQKKLSEEEQILRGIKISNPSVLEGNNILSKKTDYSIEEIKRMNPNLRPLPLFDNMRKEPVEKTNDLNKASYGF